MRPVARVVALMLVGACAHKQNADDRAIAAEVLDHQQRMDSLPRCGPADEAHAQRIVPTTRATVVKVRGVLRLGDVTCTEMLCGTRDWLRRWHNSACCNNCGGDWCLVPGGDRARAASRPSPDAAGSCIRVQQSGEKNPLYWGGPDCGFHALNRLAAHEVIVTGLLAGEGKGNLLVEASLCVVRAGSR